MFQFLSPKVEWSLANFPWAGTEGHRNRPQSCPQGLEKWFITLTSNQSAPSTEFLIYSIAWCCPTWSVTYTRSSSFWALTSHFLGGTIPNKIAKLPPLKFSWFVCGLASTWWMNFCLITLHPDCRWWAQCLCPVDWMSLPFQLASVSYLIILLWANPCCLRSSWESLLNPNTFFHSLIITEVSSL